MVTVRTVPVHSSVILPSKSLIVFVLIHLTLFGFKWLRQGSLCVSVKTVFLYTRELQALIACWQFFFLTESEKCMGGIPPRGTRLLGAPVAWTGCTMCGYDILDL
jgi:hypothetical protein